MSTTMQLRHGPATTMAAAAGQPATESLEGASLAVSAETSATASAEHARALVQAAYVVARQNPRDLLVVRERLLRRCRFPRFAEVAVYAKPQGKNPDGSQAFVRGLSVRFAEAAIQACGNIRIETHVVFDSPERRILQLTATDLETNAIYGGPIAFDKTVERRKCPQGVTPVAVRKNSYGDTLYVLPATDDEVTMRQSALISKAVRTWGLRLIPGELLDEARDVLEHTQREEVKADPGAAVRRMVDAYARGGVPVQALQEYLGHPLDVVSADELLELRALSQAIAEKTTTWREALAEKKARTVDGEPLAEPGKANAASANSAATLAASIRARRQTRGPDENPSPGSAEPTHHAREPGEEG